MNLNEALRDVILRDKGIIKFVDVGESSLDKGVLTTDKLDAFVQEMKNGTVLLDAARILTMNSFEKDIDRISMEIELESPTRDPETGELVQTDQDPTFACNTLNAKRLSAQTRLTQESIEDNIEKGTLPSTVTTVFGKAGGRALERVFIYGDTAETGVSVPTGYKSVDGWIKKCANKLYGTGEDKDFDPAITDTASDEHMFAIMMEELDTAYLENAIYWVPTKRARSYQRSLKNKDTDLGDRANLQKGQLTYEGHPVVAVPGLDWAVNTPDFFGPEAMFFGPADQFVYGLWSQVRIRTWEDVKNEMWYFFLRMRGDCHFEDERKMVCGLPGETKPE